MKIQKINETKVITTNLLPCDLCKEIYECQEEFNWNDTLGFWEKEVELKMCSKCEKAQELVKECNLKEYIKHRNYLLTKVKGGVK